MWFFSNCGATVGFLTRYDGVLREPLVRRQGSQVSMRVREQERSRSSEEVVPGLSVFPSREPGVSGNFWGHMKAVRSRFALQGGTGDFP